MFDREIKITPQSQPHETHTRQLPALSEQQRHVVEGIFTAYATPHNTLCELDRRLIDLRELKTAESIAKCQALLGHAFAHIRADIQRSCETVSSNTSSERAASLVGVLLDNGAIHQYEPAFLEAAATPLINHFCRFILLPGGIERRQVEFGHHAHSLCSYFDHAPERIVSSSGVKSVARWAFRELVQQVDERAVYTSIESVTTLYHLVSLAERLRDSENNSFLEKILVGCNKQISVDKKKCIDFEDEVEQEEAWSQTPFEQRNPTVQFTTSELFVKTIQALGASQVDNSMGELWRGLLRRSPESLGWWNALEAYARIDESKAFMNLSKIIVPLAQGILSERTVRDVSLCMIKPEFYKPILATLEKFGPRYSTSFLDQMEDQARGYGEETPLTSDQASQLLRAVLAMRAGLPVW